MGLKQDKGAIIEAREVLILAQSECFEDSEYHALFAKALKRLDEEVINKVDTAYADQALDGLESASKKSDYDNFHIIEVYTNAKILNDGLRGKV